MAAKLAALVLPLGIDTFAVAVSLGLIGLGSSARLRLSILFTAFEAGMPMIGLALGAPLGHAIGAAADYAAIGVLLAVGIYAFLLERDEEERLAQATDLRGAGALLLGISISLDELAIGFTFGLLRLPVAPAIALIAAQAFIATQLGLRLGRRLSDRLRELSERLAGVALIAVAIVLLLEKLLS